MPTRRATRVIFRRTKVQRPPKHLCSCRMRSAPRVLIMLRYANLRVHSCISLHHLPNSASRIQLHAPPLLRVPGFEMDGSNIRRISALRTPCILSLYPFPRPSFTSNDPLPARINSIAYTHNSPIPHLTPIPAPHDTRPNVTAEKRPPLLASQRPSTRPSVDMQISNPRDLPRVQHFSLSELKPVPLNAHVRRVPA